MSRSSTRLNSFAEQAGDAVRWDEEWSKLLHVACDERMMTVRFYYDYDHSEMEQLQVLATVPPASFRCVSAANQLRLRRLAESAAPPDSMGAHCLSYNDAQQSARVLRFPLGACDAVRTENTADGTITYQNQVELHIPASVNATALRNIRQVFNVQCTIVDAAQGAARLFKSAASALQMSMTGDSRRRQSDHGHQLGETLIVAAQAQLTRPITAQLAQIVKMQAMAFKCWTTITADVPFVVQGWD